MRVLIADDNIEVCKKIRNMLFERNDLNEPRVEVVYNFKDATEKLKNNFDLVFIDIELGNQKGYEAISQMRKQYNNYKTAVVYVSAYRDYAMKLFDTIPLDFMIKPIDKDKFEQIIEKYKKLNNSNYNGFSYIVNKETKWTMTREILFFESNGRKIKLHFIDGSCELIYESMKNLVQDKSLCDFIQFHQSFL